jgi:hypothetical protein
VTCGTPAQLTYAQPAGVCGRRPSADGSGRCAGDGETALGRYLAGAAALEAASVPAFGRLARDLAAHAAPDPLVRAARAAMGEEARHWRRTRDVARRRGGLPARPPIAPASFATLEEVALDNVVEGCVRETFGALIAAHQAAAAQDTEVRDLMAGITDDELGHAALSWQIDAWATPRLGPGFAERRRTTARAAVHELLLAFSAPVDGELRAAAGLPGPDEARALMAAAWAGVWQPAFGAPAAG